MVCPMALADFLAREAQARSAALPQALRRYQPTASQPGTVPALGTSCPAGGDGQAGYAVTETE
jgi:hypothetical protein